MRKYSTKLLTPKSFRLVMVIGLSGVQFALSVIRVITKSGVYHGYDKRPNSEARE